jgi:hypothetical protein
MTTERRYGTNETTTRSDAQYPESDLERRARLIVQQSKGAPGVPGLEALNAIQRDHQRRISEGEFSKSSHAHMPTVFGARADESTGDDSTDQLHAAISASQARLRKTLTAAGYSEEAIQSALVELSKREDGEAREDDGGEYIVDRLRREDAERSRSAWQK